MMATNRATLSSPIMLEGVAIHHGGSTRARLLPAISGGIVFVRNGVSIPAHVSNVSHATFGVMLSRDGEHVGVVEHLLSALFVRGITDARIEVEGPEIPIMDGSALPLVQLLDAQPLCPLDGDWPLLEITEPVDVHDEDRSVSVAPCENLEVSARIVFAHPAIGEQQWQGRIDWPTYLREIAPARTFGFLADRAQFQALGLARGASVETSLLFDTSAFLQGQQLRFDNEPVRHKVLDVLGDLSLASRPLKAMIKSDKGGHALNVALAIKLAKLL
jgi:UDP-3-O-[3-hydroxymyristoyl] N-acetylglucosamine deacetylase